MAEESYRRLPDRGSDNCFACGPNHAFGLKMKFFTDGERVYSWPKVPASLSGWAKLVHGGIISTMLDEVMGWTAVHLLKRMSLTKSITVEFLKPVQVEETLKLVGSLKEMNGDRAAVIQGELFNEAGKLCARAQGTFALFTFEAMKRRGIVDESLLDELERLTSER
jgi:uncharacterized protein (TIGR00369 family)